ncbi:hypothetical protein ACNF5H_04325 [Fannyhessea vaginae]|uniref:hypothetical protein n=1 Tax=Fannyhessea vaginae TaxID=82135 RepID=UPI003A810323
MSKCAYRDQNRKIIVYADRAMEEDRNNVFYCPNSLCDAKLYICSIDGSKEAYFRATKPEYRHVENCPYNNSSIDFDKRRYDESQFVYDEAIHNLLQPTKKSRTKNKGGKDKKGKSVAHPLRTLGQIYSMCKSLSVKSTYSNKQISEMILDDRSEYRYPKGCFGNRIIEACIEGKIYDSQKKEIYLVSPIASHKYTFILSFDDEEMYKTIRNEVYTNKNKIVVVAGKWESSGTFNIFKTNVCSKKQVLIVK